MRFVAFLSFLLFSLITVARAQVSAEGQVCLDCHSSSTPGIVEQWRESAHAKKNVDCYSRHRASEKDPAIFEHYGQRIAVIVTPNYCGRCHGKEVEQFEKSRHSQAAQFIGSLDNMLGEVVEGGPAAANGCRQCHGGEVKYLKDGKFDADTWPHVHVRRALPVRPIHAQPR